MYMDGMERWCQEDRLVDELKKDLASIVGNEKEIEDRFYQYFRLGQVECVDYWGQELTG